MHVIMRELLPKIWSYTGRRGGVFMAIQTKDLKYITRDSHLRKWAVAEARHIRVQESVILLLLEP